MEDIKIDAKLIIITICISVVFGVVLWGIYNIYLHFTENENEEVENFQGNYSSKIESLESNKSNESDLNNENFFMQPNIGKKFKINNENPKQGLKNWGIVTVNQEKAGYSTKYSIPGSSEKLRGENVQTGTFDMSYWNEDGTYEDFVQDFIEKLQSQDMGFDITYSTRKLNINGKEYIIVLRESDYILGSYFCLAQNGYACYLEIITNNKYYDNSLENTINEIFSTFTII